jgi:hypothetical protein
MISKRRVYVSAVRVRISDYGKYTKVLPIYTKER